MRVTLEFENVSELVTALGMEHAQIGARWGISPSLVGKKLRGDRPIYAREAEILHGLVVERGAVISASRLHRLIKLTGRIEPKPLWSRRDDDVTGGTVTGGGS